MSLFLSLLRLGSDHQLRVEDFCTEIVAFIFRAYPETLWDWIKRIGIQVDSSDPTRTFDVQTQIEFKKLETHEIDRRPDMRITISAKTGSHIILVESKIGSTEHFHQLKEYAEHLDRQKGYLTKWLVYITRRAELKDSKEICRDCNNDPLINFTHERWYQVYAIFRNYQSEP